MPLIALLHIKTVQPWPGSLERILPYNESTVCGALHFPLSKSLRARYTTCLIFLPAIFLATSIKGQYILGSIPCSHLFACGKITHPGETWPVFLELMGTRAANNGTTVLCKRGGTLILFILVYSLPATYCASIALCAHDYSFDAPVYRIPSSDMTWPGQDNFPCRLRQLPY